MVSLEWCKKQKTGMKIIQPNNNMAESYLDMAEESLKALSNLTQSRIWTATTSYYIFYYSLYALLLRMGIKCEIHSCTIYLMKNVLKDYYDSEDVEMMENAFKARIDLQYYSNRPVDAKIIEESKKYCKIFYIKTKDILIKITEKEIEAIRKLLN